MKTVTKAKIYMNDEILKHKHIIENSHDDNERQQSKMILGDLFMNALVFAEYETVEVSQL